MKIKKAYLIPSLALAALIAAAVLTLCGFAPTPSGQDGDRLIGAFITREYLDLFDVETYLNENVDALAEGGVISAEDESKYSGAIFAERTGTEQNPEFIFPDLDGWLCIAPVIDDENGSYTATQTDYPLASPVLHVSDTDEGSETEIAVTLYVNASDDASFYVNPVYQRGDGAVYLTSGHGISGNADEGFSMTHTVEEETNITEGKSKLHYRTKVTFTVDGETPAESIRAIQFSSDNERLSEQTFSPDSAPDCIRLEDGSGYVLLETSPVGGGTPRRSVCSDGDTFEFFSPVGDGVLAKRSVTIKK